MQIIVGIGAAFFTAAASIFLKKLFAGNSTKELGPLSLFLTAFTMLLFSPLYFKLVLDFNSLKLLVIALILESISLYFYFRAIEENEVAYAAIFMSLSPIFTMFTVVLFNNAISPSLVISLIGITSSIYVLNLESKMSIFEPIKNVFKNKNYLGLVSAVFGGIATAVMKEIFNHSYTNMFTYYLLRTAFACLVLLAFLRPSIKSYNIKLISITWGRSLLLIVGVLLSYYAVYLGNAVVGTALAFTSPIFVLIMSYFIFKQKITWQKGSAVLVAAFFVVILNIYK